MLTMVPEAQAIPGFTFKAYIDPRCFSCNYYRACAKAVRPGWRYRIRAVRGVSHFCPILGERMYVVEIEVAPLRAAVDSKVAVEGIKLKYKKIICNDRNCALRHFCAQVPLQDGEVVRVTKVLSRVACSRELHLTLVELMPAKE